MSQHHIIRRQVLEADVAGGEAQGLAVQRRLADLCQDGLARALEQAFDRAAPQDEHWTLDRLEIDAGSIGLENIERDLVAAVTRAVERQFKERAMGKHRGAVVAAGEGAAPGSVRAAGDDALATMARRSGAQSALDAFFHFLETGLLPWWFVLPAGTSLEQAMSASPPAGFGARLAQMVASPAARTRLVRQFSPAFLHMLLTGLPQDDARAVRQSVSGPRQADIPADAVRALEEVFTELGRHALAAPERKRLGERLWQAAFVLAAARRRVTAELLLAEWIALAPPGDPPAPQLLARLAQKWPALQPHAKTPQPQDATEPRVRSAPRKEAYAPVDLADGAHVACAGLVLLHPFLPRLFEALDIARGGTLLAPDRALCLFHYLATGEKRAPEYALLLPKLLCGLAPGAPAEAPAELSAAEEEEAGTLLQAVIRHWTALGDTSADGLRGTFLARPGKLLERGGDHVLQVETRSFDILLDQLPWGIGAIQLPWMTKLLWVEWRF